MSGSASSSVPEHVWVTILAGGIGSRFWPASTPTRPKPLLALTSDRTLIEETVARARGLVPDARIRILAGSHLTALFRDVLPDLPAACFLVEPDARGTAPVLTWAAHEIAALDPDAVIVSLHSDHLVRPEAAFRDLLRSAAEVAAARDVLVTIGATPDRPETGYGYIQPGEPLAGVPAGALRVAAFHEKPDAKTAVDYLAAGYLWNTGIFVWRAATLLHQVRSYAPEIARHLSRLDHGDAAGFFEACPTVTVDIAVLERSAQVVSVPCTFTWDDVGSWESLTRAREPDEAGNVSVGRALAVESERNVIYTDGAPVVAYGVEDLVIVRTRGVTFVTHRSRAPHLKALVERLPATLRDPES